MPVGSIIAPRLISLRVVVAVQGIAFLATVATADYTQVVQGAEASEESVFPEAAVQVHEESFSEVADASSGFVAGTVRVGRTP